MKARWTRNSLRLRITPSELAEVLAGETITEALHLPGGVVAWSVTLTGGGAEGIGSTGSGRVAIRLSAAQITHLSDPLTEGVYCTEEGDAPARPFCYYVEKDFPCLHPRPAEAQEILTDTFPQPADFADRKEK